MASTLTRLLLSIIITLMCMLELSAKDPTPQVTKILVEKSKRQLSLLHDDEVIKTYTIALGFDPVGHKQQEGDGKTPEGTYKVDYRNPNSRFHKSLHISYPNAEDRKQAKQGKVSPGGAVFIHGLGPEFRAMGDKHTQHDWTLGCIAVTDEEIEEICKLVPNGVLVELQP